MTAPLIQPLLYDLDATVQELYKVADQITIVPVSAGSVAVLQHEGATFRAQGALPSDAIAAVYAELTAYLADGRS